MQNKLFKNKYGISVIEVLVCLSMVSLALVGIMSLIIQNIQLQYVNKNNLISSELAQECQELIRNRRDNNWAKDPRSDFYTGVADSGGASKSYAVPIDGSDLYDLTSTGGANDFTNTLTNIYLCNGGTYNGFYIQDIPGKSCTDFSGGLGTSTVFKRMATTQYDSTHASISVDCEVRWTERGQNHNYTTSAILYRWEY